MSSYFIYQSGGSKSILTYDCTIYALKNKQIIAFYFDLGKRYECYICLTVKKKLIHVPLLFVFKIVWNNPIGSFWLQISLQELYYASHGYNYDNFIYNRIVLWLQHQSIVPLWVTSQQQRPFYCINIIQH